MDMVEKNLNDQLSVAFTVLFFIHQQIGDFSAYQGRQEAFSPCRLRKAFQYDGILLFKIFQKNRAALCVSAWLRVAFYRFSIVEVILIGCILCARFS